jgi:O-antigen ligase
METPEVVSSIRAQLDPGARSTRIARGNVALFAAFFLVGSLALLYPFAALACLAVVATVVFCWLALKFVRRAGLDAWQVILLVALTGYLLLNYGFENLAIHVGGFPIIIGYLLMYSAFALAVFSRPQLLIRATEEPALLCLLALLFLTFLHLVLDFPRYGVWALRDASMFFDGIFLLLGLLWAMKGNSTIPLMKWLMVVLLLNAVNSFTFPWNETISAWSPKSGVFQEVPLLGSRAVSAIYLLVGALFYMFLARYVVRWPRWIVLPLAMAQLAGLAILQSRAMYVGLAVMLVIFVLLGETGKSAKLVVMLSPAFAFVLLLTTLGIAIQGRIGPVRTDFFKDHFRNIVGAEGTPGSGVTERIDWYTQAFQHFLAHPVVGEGFGMVLIDYTDEDRSEHAAVRQPHNSSLSVLARQGAIGFLFWVLFHLFVLKRFLYAFRLRRHCDKQLADFIVWLFMVYVAFMLEASVEPTFEFPSAAIPFYFFVGLALGLIRWQFGQRSKGGNNAYLGPTQSARDVGWNLSR